jgi:hypothetical protein
MAVKVAVVNSGSLTWMTTPRVRSVGAGGVMVVVTPLLLLLLVLLLLPLLLLPATIVVFGVTTGAAVSASKTLKAGPDAAGSAVPFPPTGSPAA